MGITSRYSDNPDVTIDVSMIPQEFQPLLALAKEWSISDDLELDAYIAGVPEEKRRAFFESFRPHFNALAQWRRDSSHLIPRPDELILFDIAANPAATVGVTL